MSSDGQPASQRGKKIVLRPRYVKPQTKRDKLPIANYEHDFIKRLEKEKIIVVEAATGSGKSTQLPQFVAKSDLFQAERRRTTADIRYGGTKSPLGLPSQGKIVVSTQPNAFAATAVAARVGFEYDNDILGRKVGLITSTENRFDPTQCEILFVSDSELVRIMTRDKLLSRVGVLIIDEAHERTLYTDVIMSLAKQIRAARDDFYVVISSATIDVTKFLRFMLDFNEDSDGPRPRPLKVEGKTYDIAVHYDPVEVRDPNTDLDQYYAQFMVPKIISVMRTYLSPASTSSSTLHYNKQPIQQPKSLLNSINTTKGHILVFVHDSHSVFRLAHFLDRYLYHQQQKLAAMAPVSSSDTSSSSSGTVVGATGSAGGNDSSTTSTTTPAGMYTASNTKVIRLYLSMSLKEQQDIMDLVKSFHETDQSTRYIFVADNVAETSITLPDVKLVIDTGRMMVSSYDMIRRLMVTQETFVSRDRANQRKGRVGRTGAGICVRLYHENDVKKDRIDPDICRVALDKVVLQLSAMEINPVSLRLIEPPDQGKFHFAVQQLLSYQCLETNAHGDKFNHLRITEKGLKFVQLPFQPDTCEQLWQASQISNEAVSLMHTICCLNAEGTSSIYEHSPGFTWKSLGEVILYDEPFQINYHPTRESLTALGITHIPTDIQNIPPFVKHNEFPQQLPENAHSDDYPHLTYYPFDNPTIPAQFNLNSGSDLELGYFMYKLWLHYRVPNCQTCMERELNVQRYKQQQQQQMASGDTSATQIIKTPDGKPGVAMSGTDSNSANTTPTSGNNNNNMVLESSNKVDLCPSCVQAFRQKFRMVPESLQQADTLIRSTKDLVQRLLYSTRSYQPKGGVSHIISRCMYNALSHMAGVVLVTDRISEGVVLPHPYFGMVKATLDPNTCAHAISTYYTVIRDSMSPKTRYTTVRYFIAVHVIARRTHDYNISTIHPFRIHHLDDAGRRAFEANIAVLALRNIHTYLQVGKGLYSSIDLILNNRRIDNMARQYEIQTKIAQRQAAMDSFTLLTSGSGGPGGMGNDEHNESQSALSSMNWSRFIAIPFKRSRIRIYNLERYKSDSITQMAAIISEAVIHMQHLYDRERRSYRLPLAANMYADVSLTSSFKIRELIIITSDGKKFSVNTSGDYNPQQYMSHPSSSTGRGAGVGGVGGVGMQGPGHQVGYAPSTAATVANNPLIPHHLRRQQSIPQLQKQPSLSKQASMGAAGNSVGAGGMPLIGDNVAIIQEGVDLNQFWDHEHDLREYQQQLLLHRSASGMDGDITMLDGAGGSFHHDDDDDLDGIEMLDDDIDYTQPILPTTDMHDDMVDPHSAGGAGVGAGLSLMKTPRMAVDEKLSHAYDALHTTQLLPDQWAEHEAQHHYTNTLTLRKQRYMNHRSLAQDLVKLQQSYHHHNNNNNSTGATPAPAGAEGASPVLSCSPILQTYQAIDHVLNTVIKSFEKLDSNEFFPVVPKFQHYQQIVDDLFDHSTAILQLSLPLTNEQQQQTIDRQLDTLYSYQKQHGQGSDAESSSSVTTNKIFTSLFKNGSSSTPSHDDVVTEISTQYPRLHDALCHIAHYDPSQHTYAINGLLNIHKVYQILADAYETGRYLIDSSTHPESSPASASSSYTFNINALPFIFNLTMSERFHVALGPDELSIWILITPYVDELLDLSLPGLRRFIAANDRPRLLDPVSSKGHELLGGGKLVDLADLRTLQVSEAEVRVKCSEILHIHGYDLLFTESYVVDHAEIFDVRHALQEVRLSLLDSYKSNEQEYNIEVLESIPIIMHHTTTSPQQQQQQQQGFVSTIKGTKNHKKQRITLTGNRTSVTDTIFKIDYLSRPHYIPTGALTNVFNTLIQQLLGNDPNTPPTAPKMSSVTPAPVPAASNPATVPSTDHALSGGNNANNNKQISLIPSPAHDTTLRHPLFGSFESICHRFNVGANYERHVSDGSLQVYGTAPNVHAFEQYLIELSTAYEKRRHSFPLPHNVFADLKNDVENSTYYNAYYTLINEIRRIEPQVYYELKTEDTSLIIESPTVESFPRLMNAVNGFLQLCSFDDDDDNDEFSSTKTTTTMNDSSTATSSKQLTTTAAEDDAAKKLKQLLCVMCRTPVKRSTSRLSTCDHLVCGDCLAQHVEQRIFAIQLSNAEEEYLNERKRMARLYGDKTGLFADDDDLGDDYDDDGNDHYDDDVLNLLGGGSKPPRSQRGGAHHDDDDDDDGNDDSTGTLKRSGPGGGGGGPRRRPHLGGPMGGGAHPRAKKSQHLATNFLHTRDVRSIVSSYEILCPYYTKLRQKKDENSLANVNAGNLITITGQSNAQDSDDDNDGVTDDDKLARRHGGDDLTGCCHRILPSDVLRICTPQQFHSILFALSRGAMKNTNIFIPCPENACNTLIPSKPYYQQCSRCSVGYCTQCNVSNNNLHKLLPCAIFKAILGYHDVVLDKFREDLMYALKELQSKKINLGGQAHLILQPYLKQELSSRMNMIRLLQEHAQEWLNNDWIKHAYNHGALLKRPPTILMNPGLFYLAPSFIRFARGITAKLSGLPSYMPLFRESKQLRIPIDFDTTTVYNVISQLFRNSELQFSYHGTPRHENIPSILHNGFDPKYRSGQAHGRGEYFGTSPNVSYDYGREFFIISLMLSAGDSYKLVPQFCYVVDNPEDFQSSYVLPVGVVRVSKTDTRPRIPQYPQPTLKQSLTVITTATYIARLGLDKTAGVAKTEIKNYYSTNGRKTFGCDMPKEMVKVDLSKHTNPTSLPLIDEGVEASAYR